VQQQNKSTKLTYESPQPSNLQDILKKNIKN
jgi:hypothetical protein